MTKQLIAGILFLIILIVNFLLLKPNDIIYIDSVFKLDRLFENPRSNIDVHLAAGSYELSGKNFIDNTCGNCENPDTPITGTKGLQISGKNIKLIGPENGRAIIKTNAGYGIYIKDCKNCLIENLVITAGIRDSSAFATNAAIVVKNSNVIIQNNLIHQNLGDSILISKNIVGIMGICGRENSHLTIQNNEIIQNSWDAIALYRDTEAIIENNIIDGIRSVNLSFPNGGRGVGIGVTWNAKATIKNNLVRRYWKGIGIFVDAEGVIENNVVENMTTWGISLWNAGKGKPRGSIKNNIIYNCGAMGAAITSDTETNPGYFTENIIVHTAQDSAYNSSDYYGYQCALAKHSIPENFLIERNIFFDNLRANEDLPDYDISEEEFKEKMEINRVWIMSISNLEKSDFYRKFVE